jgi:hypothetical protein
MKQLFFILIVLLGIINLQGQTKKTQALIDEIAGQWETDENKNLFYQKVIEMPGVDKSMLFQRAENYFIYNYGSGKDVIQTKDKEQGLIIGKGIWPNIYFGVSIGSYKFGADHILRIDIKDEKARITLTVQRYNVEYRYDKTVMDYPALLLGTYPINADSKSKTMEGKAFYNLHQKCVNTLNNLTDNMKNDAIKQTNSSW